MGKVVVALIIVLIVQAASLASLVWLFFYHEDKLFDLMLWVGQFPNFLEREAGISATYMKWVRLLIAGTSLLMLVLILFWRSTMLALGRVLGIRVTMRAAGKILFLFFVAHVLSMILLVLIGAGVSDETMNALLRETGEVGTSLAKATAYVAGAKAGIVAIKVLDGMMLLGLGIMVLIRVVFAALFKDPR